MRTLILIAALFAAPILQAQQNVPVTIPQQMMPVTITVKGMDGTSCTFTATGGTAIAITILNCPTTPPPTSVSGVTVSGPASLAAGATGTYSATVQGVSSPSQSVTWTATGGSITSAGVFTPTAGVIAAVVTATSALDPTKSSSLSITITPAVVASATGATCVLTNQACKLTDTNAAVWSFSNVVDTQGRGNVILKNGVATTDAGKLLLWFNGQLYNQTNSNSWWTVPQGVKQTGDPRPPAPAAPSVAITWVASVSPDLAGYRVYRSTTSGSGFTAITLNPIPAGPLVDTNVISGIKYFYVVTAVGSVPPYTAANAESTFSPEANATP